MKRVIFILLIPILFFGRGTGKPNIIVIMPDDVGHNNHNLYDSPAWDYLAANGKEIVNFYTHPVCSPSRHMFRLGRYQFATDRNVDRPLGCGKKNKKIQSGFHKINGKQVETIATSFRDQKYKTDFLGKWHTGHLKGDRPEDNGYSYGYYTTQSGIDYYTRLDGCGDYEWDMYDNGVLTLDQHFKHNEYVTYDITQDAIERINVHESNGDNFYLEVSYSAVHTPIQPPDPESEADPYTEVYEAMQEGVIDIINAVDDLENTIIVYISDNGGDESLPMGNSIDAPATNFPLRDGKRSSFEGGINSVALIMWQGHIEVGQMTDEMTLMDVYPTLADMAGCDTPIDLNGKSAVKGLFGNGGKAETRFEVNEYCNRYSFPPTANNCHYFDGVYKYVNDQLNGQEYVFDIKNDPNESNDLSSDRVLLNKVRSKYLLCAINNLEL